VVGPFIRSDTGKEEWDVQSKNRKRKEIEEGKCRAIKKERTVLK